jgi:quinoprotein glucose dehydrogenase
VVDFTPEIESQAREALTRYRIGPLFTPPSIEGTVTRPGPVGAVGWGGAAFDPTTNTLYVPGKERPAVVRLVPPPPGVSDADFIQRIGGIGGPGGLPIGKPPYGTLTAIDLDRGEHRWQVTVGDIPRVQADPRLSGLDLGPLGQLGNSGPMATAGGLVFLSGNNSELYAFDSGTGELIWSADLGGREGTSNPMTYLDGDGRQIIVLGVSMGSGADGGLIAFALPKG